MPQVYSAKLLTKSSIFRSAKGSQLLISDISDTSKTQELIHKVISFIFPDYFSNQRKEFNDVDNNLLFIAQQHAQPCTKESMCLQCQLHGSRSLDT